ncbi:MAG: RsmE family RNA methyltransferase [Acidobacteria bacterium]|nr:RsmE family RNA methyltransferase [Acidobacteriota bacterium]
MALRRVFVDDVRDGETEVEGAEAHHLARVVRLKTGEEVELSDGCRLFRARVTDAAQRRVRFVVEEELPALDDPTPQVVLQIALFQFPRFEWALEKATELGVGRVIPVIAERSENHLVKAAPKRLERWRRIAEQAAQQSRRMAAAVVDDPLGLDALLSSEAAGARLVLHPGGDPLAAVLARTCGQPFRLLVGPEGGWTDAEVALAEAAGYRRAGMGGLILRCETAAIAALSVITHIARPER